MVEVAEAAIEDVFVTRPSILCQLLGWNHDLSLVARQLRVPSGRLDLLFVSLNRLLLIELKVERFRSDFVDQIVGYKRDLSELQGSGSLIEGDIDALLLVTEFGTGDQQICSDKGVRLVAYNPEAVLKAYYDQMAGISGFLRIRPADLGVWHVHVTHRVLYSLAEHHTILQISKVIGVATNTVRNHLRFGQQLGLVRRYAGKHFLTDLGMSYVQSQDPVLSPYRMSQAQMQLLRRHIARDPFSSGVVFGIYSLVESVFTLARNSYPVALQDLITYYRETVGKRFEWATERSASLGTNAFSNFAVELGLIAVMGDKVLLTPSGFRFVLMLQLHKGIQLVDSLEERGLP